MGVDFEKRQTAGQYKLTVGFDAAFDKSPERIQKIVDNGPDAECYCTDGYLGYIDVVYPGKHIRNACNKSDTFTVESINADLRHYIPILRRRSRCFPRKLEKLRAVLELFVQAYNDFGIAKMNFRQNHLLPYGYRSPSQSVGTERSKIKKYSQAGFSFTPKDAFSNHDYHHSKSTCRRTCLSVP